MARSHADSSPTDRGPQALDGLERLVRLEAELAAELEAARAEAAALVAQAEAWVEGEVRADEAQRSAELQAMEAQVSAERDATLQTDARAAATLTARYAELDDPSLDALAEFVVVRLLHGAPGRAP